MSSDLSSDPMLGIARCQSEHPDIYDAHYDAVAWLRADHTRATRRSSTQDKAPTHDSG